MTNVVRMSAQAEVEPAIALAICRSDGERRQMEVRQRVSPMVFRYVEVQKRRPSSSCFGRDGYTVPRLRFHSGKVT